MSPIISGSSGSANIGTTSGASEPLGAHPGYTQELLVGRGDVCDWAVRFERLRRKLPIGWISTVAWLLLGAGFGAWIQNGKWSAGSIACAVAGSALLVGMVFAQEERGENVHNLCDDFLRFVDRWQAMDGYEKNSEYVLEIVSQDKRGGLTSLVGRVKGLRWP